MGWADLSRQGKADASASRRGQLPHRRGLSPLVIRWGTVSAVVAALVIVAVRFAVGPDAGTVPAPDEPRTRPAPTPIARKRSPPATKPAPVRAVPTRTGERQQETDGKRQNLKTYRDERGILRYEGGLRVPGQRPLAKPIQLGSHQPRVFRHPAEEHISWLLDMKIGEPIIGDYTYGEAFTKSLRESLEEPVEILDTDDPHTRELKAAVQETKEELRTRMKAGEDAAKVMNDTMNEFRRLARYRHELQARIHEIRADTEKYTDEDVENFTKAANEMLRREGLPPLTLPRAVMRGLRRR